MQCANENLSWMCGLAKNIPFMFGKVTILLQAHIMKTVFYRILLG